MKMYNMCIIISVHGQAPLISREANILKTTLSPRMSISDIGIPYSNMGGN